MANYQIENWIHILACSNSIRALKLSMGDRRWFVPKLTESKQSVAYWERLNGWLTDEGGLGIIKCWAEQYVKKQGAVIRGEDAPWTLNKKLMIEEGYSPGQTIAMRVLESIKERIQNGKLPKDSFILDTQIVRLISHELYEGRFNDKLERPSTVRAMAKAGGWFIGEERANIVGWGPEGKNGRVITMDQATAALTPRMLCGEQLPEAERRRPVDIQEL